MGGWRWDTNVRRGMGLAAMLCALLVGAAWLPGCGGGGGASLSGTVVVDTAERTPLPDARVVAGGVLTRSDANGKFSAADPAKNTDGKVPLSVSKVGYRSYDQAVDPSSSPQVRLAPRALTEYGTVTGTVVDVTTSNGIGLVELEVQPIFGGEVTPQEEIQFAHTAADGSFQVTGFLGGNGRIVARATGYLTAQVPISIEVGDPPPAANPYTIELTPTSERMDVEGLVTDLETGSPLAGVAVHLGAATATTRSNGTFTVVGVPVGQVTVTASADGYDPYSATVTVEAAMDQVRIALSRSTPAPDPPGNVKGTVALEGGGSPAGATVTAMQGTLQADRATVTSSGKYGLLLPPGTYLLRAAKSGYATEERTVIVPNTGEVQTGINFTLSP